MFRLTFFLALATLASADVSHLFRKPANTLSTPFSAHQTQFKTYQPVRHFAQPTQQFSQPIQHQPVQHQSYHSGQHVNILKQNQEVQPDGSFQYGFETENGISAQESGSVHQVGNDVAQAVQGSYVYTSPEGEAVQISYVADENGYQPVGSHIPTPPPIPAAILRALEYIKAHPQQEERVGNYNAGSTFRQRNY